MPRTLGNVLIAMFLGGLVGVAVNAGNYHIAAGVFTYAMVLNLREGPVK